MDRWDRLFLHLEAEHEFMEKAARSDTTEQIRQAEIRRIRLPDRLRAHLGLQLRVIVEPSNYVEGVLEDVSDGWILLSSPTIRHIVVDTGVVGYVGLTAKIQRPEVTSKQEHAGQPGRGLSSEGQDALARLRARTTAPVNVSLPDKLRELLQQRQCVLVQTCSTRFEGNIVGVFSDHLTLRVQVANASGIDAGGIPQEVSISLDKVVSVGVPVRG